MSMGPGGEQMGRRMAREAEQERGGVMEDGYVAADNYGGSGESGENEDADYKAALDDLFFLKERILRRSSGGRRVLAGNAAAYLSQIESILIVFPRHSESLYRWGFLTQELLCAMRGGPFALCLKIASFIVGQIRRIPDRYCTREFLFFITERLYQKMSERQEENEGLLPGAALRVGSLECFYSVEDILRFVIELISIRSDVVRPLYDVGFFILANSIIGNETCRLYDTVFASVYFCNDLYFLKNQSTGPEALFEIRREHFDPEIIFRDKEIIALRRQHRIYKKGIYEAIYSECTNLRHFLDLNIQDSLNLLSYKRIIFHNDNLDLLIREKHPRAIRGYRRVLEAGATISPSYCTPLVQCLDIPDTRLDAAICLYYLIDALPTLRGFTEARIRSIFSCLESHCTAECPLNQSDSTSAFTLNYSVNGTDAHNQSPPVSSCENIQNITDPCTSASVFPSAELASTIYSDCSNPPGPPPSSGHSAGEAHNPSNQSAENIHLCSRTRVLILLKSLYSSLPKSLFYKPSYLILIRCQAGHCHSELPFQRQFCREFLQFVSTSSSNLARILFPLSELSKPPHFADAEFANGLSLGDFDISVDGATQASEQQDEDHDDQALAEQIKRMRNSSNTFVKTINSRMIFDSTSDEQPLVRDDLRDA